MANGAAVLLTSIVWCILSAMGAFIYLYFQCASIILNNFSYSPFQLVNIPYLQQLSSAVALEVVGGRNPIVFQIVVLGLLVA